MEDNNEGLGFMGLRGTTLYPLIVENHMQKKRKTKWTLGISRGLQGLGFAILRVPPGGPHNNHNKYSTRFGSIWGVPPTTETTKKLPNIRNL